MNSSKKVLICIPCLLTGGTEIQTLNIVEALIRSNHRVITVCYFEFNHDMILRYQQAGSKVICLSPSGERKEGKNGIIFLYKGLKQVVQTVKPDVVHVQYMAPGAIPILLLRIIGIKKIIATAHTVGDIYPSLKLIHFIQKHCVRAFTCITQIAELSFFGMSCIYTQQTPLQKRNHFTIYNALPSYIQIRKGARDFSSPITLGVVSRLEKIKGMDLVIPAFAQIRKRHPEIHLLIVGDGSQKELMQQQANDLNIIENITWAGRQGQGNLQDYYDKINILLMPSRSEGFGLTAIEGMARGCVVVASNTGGLPEIVINEKVGLLHKQEDIEDMKNTVCRLIQTPLLMKQLSDNAITHVRKFSQSTFQELIEDLYNKI